jgi:hypothetical protein
METKAVVVKLPGYGAVEVKIRGEGAGDATPLTPRLVGLVSRTQDNSEGLKKAERIREKFQAKAREVLSNKITLFWE